MSRRKRLRETFTIGGAPQPARTRRAPREDRQVNADVRPSPGTGVGRVRFAGQDVADAVAVNPNIAVDTPNVFKEYETVDGILREVFPLAVEDDVAVNIAADPGQSVDAQPTHEAEEFSGIDRATTPSMSFLTVDPAPFTEELNKELRKEIRKSSPKTPLTPSSTKRRKRGKR